MLFSSPLKVIEKPRPLPDWSVVHQELTRKGVTLFLLWEEYLAGDPSGYQYSWFCQQYRAWAHRIDLPMRQVQRAGETLFVDYAGQTVGVVNPRSGEIRQAQIFVAVLGASNYTYAEATWSQQIPDWIGSHMRAFSYMDGVPEVVVPDNLKSAVTKTQMMSGWKPPAIVQWPSLPAGTRASSPSLKKDWIARRCRPSLNPRQQRKWPRERSRGHQRKRRTERRRRGQKRRLRRGGAREAMPGTCARTGGTGKKNPNR